MARRGKVLVERMIIAVIAIVMMILVTKSWKIKNVILSETKNEKY